MSDCTGLYVTWIEPLTVLFHVIVLGVATGAISLVLTKSKMFEPMHAWLEKHNTFLSNLLDCPWCTSHWVALFFVLIYRPLLLDWGWRPAWMRFSLLDWFLTPVDYLVTVMVMVTVASVAARIIWSAYKPMFE
jgi:hypothetical protein